MEFGHAQSRGICAAAQQCIHHPSSRNPVAMGDLVLRLSKRSSSNPRGVSQIDANTFFSSGCSRIALYLLLAPLAAMFAGVCRHVRRIWRNDQALFRHLLLQIGRANIENPPSSSSLAEEQRLRRSIDLARFAR
jgi:hypothetical protein